MTDLETTQKAVDEATAAVAKATPTRDAQLAREAQAMKELAEKDAALRRADPGNAKLLDRLESDRLVLRLRLEAIREGALPRSQAAVDEAENALRQATEARDRAQRAAELERLMGECGRIEADLLRLARSLRGEVEPLLRAHREASRAGRALGQWEGLDLPEPAEPDAHIGVFMDRFDSALRVLDPPPPPPPTVWDRAAEEARQAADRRNDERFLRSLTRREAEPAARDSGLTETQLAILRGPPKPPRPLTEEFWKGKDQP